MCTFSIFHRIVYTFTVLRAVAAAGSLGRKSRGGADERGGFRFLVFADDFGPVCLHIHTRRRWRQNARFMITPRRIVRFRVTRNTTQQRQDALQRHNGYTMTPRPSGGKRPVKNPFIPHRSAAFARLCMRVLPFACAVTVCFIITPCVSVCAAAAVAVTGPLNRC